MVAFSPDFVRVSLFMILFTSFGPFLFLLDLSCLIASARVPPAGCVPFSDIPSFHSGRQQCNGLRVGGWICCMIKSCFSIHSMKRISYPCCVLIIHTLALFFLLSGNPALYELSALILLIRYYMTLVADFEPETV